MHQGAGPGTELASGVGCRARQKRDGKPGSRFSNYLLRWKQDTDMGKVNNQKFVNIPFNRFISDLEYKCRQKGIRVILHEESYTSKCSFFDDEEITKHETYCGKRVARGLFKTKEDKLINADLNGSLNIMKKALSSVDEWNPELWKQCVMQNLNSAVERRKVILS
ncbi:IS200/IS605 family accessory protein TnpB-related protein [uncultured Dubosiella sp.]|nr:IS200/IS605 family accessory protein TnpB-related protein [uncultured Dubosiella sp.]